jgi:hypothetical protein
MLRALTYADPPSTQAPSEAEFQSLKFLTTQGIFWSGCRLREILSQPAHPHKLELRRARKKLGLRFFGPAPRPVIDDHRGETSSRWRERTNFWRAITRLAGLRQAKGRDLIRTAEKRERCMELVKGYMTRAVRGRVRYVALFADGTIKITVKDHDRDGNWFNHGFLWEVIKELPDDLEFIGSYPANM